MDFDDPKFRAWLAKKYPGVIEPSARQWYLYLRGPARKRDQYRRHTETFTAARKRYRAANPEKVKKLESEARKRWAAKYPEKARRWAKQHPEQMRQFSRMSYLKHAAERRAKAKEYRERNIEKIRERDRVRAMVYLEANRDAINAKHRARYATGEKVQRAALRQLKLDQGFRKKARVEHDVTVPLGAPVKKKKEKP